MICMYVWTNVLLSGPIHQVTIRPLPFHIIFEVLTGLYSTG